MRKVISEADIAEAYAAREKALLEHIRASQVQRGWAIGIGGVVIFAALTIWPTLYPYQPYFTSPHFFQDVLRFWPLAVWAVLVNIPAAFGGMPLLRRHDETLFVQRTLVSVGAGVTEELWFRCVGPFFYMIGIMATNSVVSQAPMLAVVLSGVLMAIIAGAFVFPRAYRLPVDPGRAVLFFLAAGIVFQTPFTYHGPDAFYQMVNRVLYPITEFISFGTMTPVLFGTFPWLLVAGMFFANFSFRDGHRYQGPVGWVNAWWLGCVFIFATLQYGLLVAVAVHALFDIVVGLLQYVVQKLAPEPSSQKTMVVEIQ